MTEYRKIVIRQRKWMLYLLAVIVLGAGFSPYPRFFNGLVLGTAFSFYHLWILHRNMERFGAMIINQGKRTGTGTFIRLGGAALAALIALRYEEYFHIVGVAIGLCTAYIVVFIDLTIHFIKDDSRSK